MTGSSGLVGFECCRLFREKGWSVIGVDNYMRARIFGQDGDTSSNTKTLVSEYGIEYHQLDYRDAKVTEMLKDADAVIHAASQPSHPRSIQIPAEDFEINASGTFYLLENLRRYNKDCVFVFCSTHKVYGENPNFFSYKRVGKRFEPVDPSLFDGFSENLRIDQAMHTPFGVSKLTGDMYTQEYAKLYGLKTGSFRMSCITGGASRAVEEQNWEPYFIKKALAGEKVTIFGYQGYQVRDVIHANDLARLFYEFILNPRPGEVYNIGGGRDNALSLLESLDLIEEVSGKRLAYEDGPQREADYAWWITNINKVSAHYPNWKQKHNLKSIFSEITEALKENKELIPTRRHIVAND